MLGICLKILSILGIILLILLGVVIGGILLVLFFPVSYRFYGSKNLEGIRLTARFGWLFGLFRVNCEYPVPGCIKVKFLFFTLYNQKLPPDKDGGDSPPKKPARKKKSKKSKGKKESINSEAKSKTKNQRRIEERSSSETAIKSDEKTGKDSESLKDEISSPNGDISSDGNISSGADASANEEASAAGSGKTSFTEKISSKIEKIKYTIYNIYDKIKKIWKNISYYIAFLQEEETKKLRSDSLTALKGILKSLRPKHVRADIQFGTGAPDTTGYIYGIYCMLSSSWKPGILVTPDFEEAVLQGELEVSGRIPLWVFLVNGLKMYKLIRKLTAAMKVSA